VAGFLCWHAEAALHACRKNGMQALMKYWNDPQMLAKIGERMGDVSGGADAPAPGPGSSAAAAAPALEINTLLDAAKCARLTQGRACLPTSAFHCCGSFTRHACG
jgi:hypothetical protein